MAKVEIIDEYTPEETKRRMENALRRALNTERKPNEAFIGKKKAKKPTRDRAKP